KSGGFGGGRGGHSVLVNGRERKLTERDAHLIAKLCFHLFQHRMKQTTRRTFKITKLFEVHHGVCRPMRIRGLGAGNAWVNGGLLNGRCLCSRRRWRWLPGGCWSCGHRSR